MYLIFSRIAAETIAATTTATSGPGNIFSLPVANALHSTISAMVSRPMQRACAEGPADDSAATRVRGMPAKFCEPGADRLPVQHDVELRAEDQHADAGQHAVDDGRRDRAEPLAQLEQAGGELHQPGEQHDHAQHRDAVLLHELPDEHGQARCRTADLQRRAGDRADHQAADDAGDQPRHRRHAGGDRDAHAQRQRHEEDDDRGERVLADRRPKALRELVALCRSRRSVHGGGFYPARRGSFNLAGPPWS